MNSLISSYRKTPNGAAYQGTDEDLLLLYGKRADENPDLRKRLEQEHPDFVEQYDALKSGKSASPAEVLVADQSTALPPQEPTKQEDDALPQAEGFWGTVGREFASDIAPAIGTAVGAAGGATASALAAIPLSGGIGAPVAAPVAAVAGGIAGGVAGGVAARSAQNYLMGDERVKANDAQREANQQENPWAAQMGSMIPFMISMLGGGGAGKASEKLIEKVGPKMAQRIQGAFNASIAGGRASLSGTAQKDISDGKDVPWQDYVSEGARNAVVMGAGGMVLPAKSILEAVTKKAVADTVAQQFASAVYDSVVEKKEASLRKFFEGVGSDLPANVIMNAIVGKFVEKLPVRSTEAPAAQRATQARQAAAANANNPPASFTRPAPPKESPMARAVQLFSKDPVLAEQRLDALRKTTQPTPEEAAELSTLERLIPPPASAATTALAPNVSQATAAPAPAPAPTAAAPVTPAPAVPATQTPSPPTPSPTPAAVDASTLRKRMTKAVAAAGRRTSKEFDAALTDITKGAFDDAVVTRLEAAVQSMQAKAPVELAQATLEKNAKRSNVRLERMQTELRKQQRGAFKDNPDLVVSELQDELLATQSAGGDATGVASVLAELQGKLQEQAAKQAKAAEALAKKAAAKAEKAAKVEAARLAKEQAALAPAPITDAKPIPGAEIVPVVPEPPATRLMHSDLMGTQGDPSPVNVPDLWTKAVTETTKPQDANNVFEGRLVEALKNITGKGGSSGADKSATKLAIVLRLSDGTVVQRPLILNRRNEQLQPLEGTARVTGVRVGGMAKGGRNSKQKVFTPEGSEPITLREALERSAVPIDILHFEKLGEPRQNFANDQEYFNARNNTPTALTFVRSVDSPGGDNQFDSGGATKDDGEGQSRDAVEAAESQQTITANEVQRELESRIDMTPENAQQALSALWKKGVDQGISEPLIKAIKANGGSVAEAEASYRDKMATAKAKGRPHPVGEKITAWLGDMRRSLPGVDAFIEEQIAKGGDVKALDQRLSGLALEQGSVVPTPDAVPVVSETPAPVAVAEQPVIDIEPAPPARSAPKKPLADTRTADERAERIALVSVAADPSTIVKIRDVDQLAQLLEYSKKALVEAEAEAVNNPKGRLTTTAPDGGTVRMTWKRAKEQIAQGIKDIEYRIKELSAAEEKPKSRSKKKVVEPDKGEVKPSKLNGVALSNLWDILPGYKEDVPPTLEDVGLAITNSPVGDQLLGFLTKNKLDLKKVHAALMEALKTNDGDEQTVAFARTLNEARAQRIADTHPVTEAQRIANTQLAIDRLSTQGINVRRVVEVMGAPDAQGANYGPTESVIALSDARFGTMEGLVAALHEGAHALFIGMPRSVQDGIARAVERAAGKMRSRAEAAAKETGVAVARNFDLTPEERLVETAAQEAARDGIVADKNLVGSLVRWTRELYLRAAHAMLRGVGAPEYLVDSYSQMWWENNLRRITGGDYEIGLINVIDRFLPASPAQRAQAMEAPMGTPRGMADYVDIVTGELKQPTDADFFMRPRALRPELDLADKEARDRTLAASLNEIVPMLDTARMMAAPKMTAQDFWLKVGRGEEPTDMLKQVESSSPGASSVLLSNTDKMTEPMIKQAARDALAKTLVIARRVRSDVARHVEKINDSAKVFVAKTARVQKTEAAWRDAKVLQESIMAEAKDSITEVASDIKKGVVLSSRSGWLERGIADADNLTTGEVIPKQYAKVMDAITSGQQPIMDSLSAIAKLGLDLDNMGVRQAVQEITAKRGTDPRLEELVKNRDLLVTLTTLARNHGKEVGLLELRQLKDSAQSVAIKAELEQIRKATEGELDKIWDGLQSHKDQTSLSTRLKLAYLKERRALRNAEKTIKESQETVDILRVTEGVIAEKVLELEKRVGNYSRWDAVDGAVWQAMKEDGRGGWLAEDRKLNLDERQRVLGADQLRQDLADNIRYLKENQSLANTAQYEAVKRQTEVLNLENFRRDTVSTDGGILTEWMDKLIRSLPDKFKSLGTRGGELLSQSWRKMEQIKKAHWHELAPMADKWSANLRSVYDKSGKYFKSYNDFYSEVIVPAIYKIESSAGKEESFALKVARDAATERLGLKLTPDELKVFHDELDGFLRTTKTISDKYLELAEKYGVMVQDPKLKDQLRRAVAYGWMTVPRSVNYKMVRMVNDVMAKAGWTPKYKESVEVINGTEQVTKKVAGGDTFNRLDMKDAALEQKLVPFFTPEIIEKFLVPFIRHPGKPVFMAEGKAVDNAVTEKAWLDSGGNVLQWIDLMGDRTDALINIAKRSQGVAGPSPQEVWRRSMLNQIDRLYVMEHNAIHSSGAGASLYNPTASKAHILMDARTNDLLPPEHVHYSYFDPTQANAKLSELAFHAAFGRDGQSAALAIDSARKELDQRITDKATIWGRYESKADRAKAAKDMGYDYKTLKDAENDKKRLKAWEEQFTSLMTRNGGRGVVDDVNLGEELIRTSQALVLNQPTSGLWQILSLADWPIVFGSIGKTSTKASVKAVETFLKEGFGSMLQDVGINAERYLSSDAARMVGPMIDRRALNKQEWSVRMADVGNKGEYGNQGNSWAMGAKQVARGINTALDKGLTPTSPLRALFGQGSADGAFGRFNLLTSPFRFLSDTASKAIAITNVQLYENLVRKGMQAMTKADYDNPNFKFDRGDLGLDGFGDKGAYDYYSAKSREHGLGTIEDVVRQAIDRKAKGGTLLDRDQAIKLAIMALDDVALESSTTTRPIEMYTNPVVRMATPMLGWPIASMNRVNQMMKTPEGKATMGAVLKGLGVLAGVALGPSLAMSFGMEQWDEQVRGKKSNMPAMGVEQSDGQNAIGLLARLAKAGNIYGLGMDAAYSMISPLDASGTGRGFTLDSRVFAYSQLKTLAQALIAIPMQDWNMTWAGGARNIMLSLGGNGPLQYIQILNQMGLNVNQAEAEVIQRQNIYASVRQAAAVSGISVKKGGGAVTPTEEGLWIREMQLAAFAGDASRFHENYLKALAEAEENGEKDPQARVRYLWRGRDPFRVLDNKPSEVELQTLYAAMDESSRRLVQEAVTNYERFKNMLEPTPMEKKIKRRMSSLESRLEARRKAIEKYSYAP